MYIGDGAYANFDGYQIWLRTNEIHPGRFENNIALEPEVFRALMEYAKELNRGTEENVYRT